MSSNRKTAYKAKAGFDPSPAGQAQRRIEAYRRRAFGSARRGAADSALADFQASMQLAQAAKNLRSAGFTGQEVKFLDFWANKAPALLSTGVASAECDPSTVNCLNAIDIGTGISGRIGRKVHLTSVSLKGYVRRDGQTFSTAAEYRTYSGQQTFYIAIVLDKQSNGAQLSSEDVFTVPAPDSSCVPFLNLEHKTRFQVLASTTITLDPPGDHVLDGTDIETPPVLKPFSLYKKLNLPVLYSGTGSGISDITDNSLHVVAYVNSGSDPVLNYTGRIRFTDA